MPRRNIASAMICVGVMTVFPGPASATEWFVAQEGTGSGTRQAPFGAVGAALLAAQPGDTVTVGAGTYDESVRTVRNGSTDAPIRVRSEKGPGTVVLRTSGTVLQINHSFVIIEDLVIDAGYAPHVAVKVAAGIQSVVMRRMEVRRSSRDCVNIGAAVNVLIEDALIHHCLNPTKGRTDAHGIVASAVRGLTVRGTEIHTFSGDAIQLNRTGTAHAPGWDDVLIERCRFWLAPMPEDENGFPAGRVPGENAVDTKVAPESPRARITVRDTQVWGFGGVIRQQAAFNLKERVDATLDGITVSESDIAFRLRGAGSSSNGAWVRIQNAVVYDVNVGIRYEDDIQQLRVWNATFGLGVAHAFEEASSTRGRPEVRNIAVVCPDLPSEAFDPSNLAVGPESFVNAGAHDYRLTARSPAVDAGTRIPGVDADREGTRRPQGRAPDVGAYERCAADCASAMQ